MKLLLLTCLSLFVFGVFGQRAKDSTRKGQLFLDTANTVELDTSLVLFEENITLDHSDVISVDADTIAVNDSAIFIVDSAFFTKYDTMPLSRGVKAVLKDSAYWMGIDSLFVIFDSLNKDPYKYDGANFKDTLSIVLYDTLPDSLGNLRSWSMPLQRTHFVTSKFGFRRYKWHYGIDLRLSIGDSVTSCFDGVVRVSKYNYGGYGHYIIVRHHNGLETLYGHLSKRLLNVGDHVAAGELVGWGGNSGHSSGPHLHFEIHYRGEPLDPAMVYNFSCDSLRYQTLELTPKYFDYIREMRRRIYYRVRSGDTLFGIANKFHVSWRKIAKFNRITTRTTLRIGQRLRIR